jgi:hypothetical protein
MGRYLNVQRVDANAAQSGTHVRIYSNGVREVAPDPRDKSAVDGCRETYGAGYFIRWRETAVPADKLDDCLEDIYKDGR